MAKPKHPTLKSLRQGQTVYMVADESIMYDEQPGTRMVVVQWFLHSHNIPDPPVGTLVSKMPVVFLKKHIRNGNADPSNFYYSRRRAEGAIS